jgi:hypothetical protein
METLINTIEYKPYSFWGFTFDVIATIKDDGTVSATTDNIRLRYPPSWNSMHFMTKVENAEYNEHLEDTVDVDVKIDFEGMDNKFSVKVIEWGQEDKYWWGPATGKIGKKEWESSFRFENYKGAEELKPQDSETFYDGPEFDEPTLVVGVYSIELTPLNSTKLTTSVDRACKLKVSVKQIKDNGQIILPAPGIKVTFKKPQFGFISYLSLVTDTKGECLVTYYAPTAEEMEKLDKDKIEVIIEAKENMTGNKDFCKISVDHEKTDLIVKAEYEIIPADTREYNTIYFKYTGQSKPDGAPYKIKIRPTLADGRLFDNFMDEEVKKELDLKIRPDEIETIYYRWYGEKKLDKAQKEVIEFSIPEVSIVESVAFDVGIDIELVELHQNWTGGFLAAGYHPFKVIVRDTFHPDVDLRILLNNFPLSTVKVTNTFFEPLAFSQYSIDREDILSFFIAHIIGVTMPSDSITHNIFDCKAAKYNEGLWFLRDEYGQEAYINAALPGVTPFDRGNYKYKFDIEYESDSDPDNNSKETGILTVYEGTAIDENFMTFIVPTLKAYFGLRFPLFGLFNLVVDITLNIREGKFADAMKSAGAYLISNVLLKTKDKQSLKYLKKVFFDLMYEIYDNVEYVNEKFDSLLGYAKLSLFSWYTGSFVKKIVEKLKNEEDEKRDVDAFWETIDPWKALQGFSRGYSEYGFAVLIKATLNSFEAFDSSGKELLPVQEQIFGGGKENEAIFENEDVAVIPFPLEQQIEILVNGKGIYGENQSNYYNLGRCIIVTSSGIKTYQYPESTWDTKIHIDSNELIFFEGAELIKNAALWNGPGIFIDFEYAKAGEEVEITYSAGENYGRKAWVGIIPSNIEHGSVSENDKADITYEYIPRNQLYGQLSFKIPEDAGKGQYQFRMFPDRKDIPHEVAFSTSFMIE